MAKYAHKDAADSYKNNIEGCIKILTAREMKNETYLITNLSYIQFLRKLTQCGCVTISVFFNHRHNQSD